MANRIPVPLDLEDFEVLGAEVIGDVLEIDVVSTFPRACHHCGSLRVIGHGRRQRRIRDLAFGHPTVLRWSQRRFRCVDCDKTSRERHPCLAGRRLITNRFRRKLFERACLMPFSQVADAESTSAYRVVDAFEAHVSSELAQPVVAPRVLSLDESAFRRRFRFHTIVSDPENGCILDMVEGRDKAAGIAALTTLESSVLQGIETVVTDCHWPYRQAVEMVLPHVRLVADKFHVIRSIDEAAQKVRRRTSKRPRHMRVGRDGGVARGKYPTAEPQVFHVRWTFMKRSHKLTESQRGALTAVFDQVPELEVAWLMKEAFASIYDSPDRTEAERRLDVWIHHVGMCGIREFSDTWRTLQWWRDQILNYFDDPLTNGFAEGITNKIKVMKRMSYGFRCPERYRHKVLLMSRRRRSRRAKHQIS